MEYLHPFQSIEHLSNRYYSLRHGLSVPQSKGLIVSKPENGLRPEWGLEMEGFDQIFDSVRDAILDGILDRDTIVRSSDFSRTRESAEEARDVLNDYHVGSRVIISKRLRERVFGIFELTSNANYTKVWAKDEQDMFNTEDGVESPVAVQRRFADEILVCERKYRHRDIVLVGHGDLLQIGETNFRRLPPSMHRTIPHLKNAELRQLILRDKKQFKK